MGTLKLIIVVGDTNYMGFKILGGQLFRGRQITCRFEVVQDGFSCFLMACMFHTPELRNWNSGKNYNN